MTDTLLTQPDPAIPDNVPVPDAPSAHPPAAGPLTSDGLQSQNVRPGNSWDEAMKGFPPNAGILSR